MTPASNGDTELQQPLTQRQMKRTEQTRTRKLATTALAKQKWPEQLEVVADFPRTDSGKILRTKLKEQFARGTT